MVHLASPSLLFCCCISFHRSWPRFFVWLICAKWCDALSYDFFSSSSSLSYKIGLTHSLDTHLRRKSCCTIEKSKWKNTAVWQDTKDCVNLHHSTAADYDAADSCSHNVETSR